MSNITIGYVNVYVSALAPALEFYGEKLGLSLGTQDAEHGYASFGAGPVTLGVAVAGDDHPELIGGMTGIGLVVDNLEAEHARLSALGVDFPMLPERMPWGGFMALVADPDGNQLYLDEVSAVHG
jgi:predicted enzyme related to lactoylglutathione lyase